jgi:glyoxylase-like metal-dependent hydrolase (beta-lactamase superfamily II)
MSRPHLVADQGFVEVASRVWVARHSWLDVNVTVVEGERGLIVVDTLGSDEAARGLLHELRRLSRRDVVAVVNTHDHYDHVVGNDLLRQEWPGVPVHAHEDAAPGIPGADRLFSSVMVVDLGDRVLELVHPGRGHTAGDIVVRVPDVDVVLAGDLVEESAPPSYGPDSFPLDWPAALDFVVGLLTADSVVVPGHGALVDQRYVEEQRGDVGTVAETIFDLASRSVPVEEALRDADWPFPAEGLADAVRRGYDQVPRTSRRLPLA